MREESTSLFVWRGSFDAWIPRDPTFDVSAKGARALPPEFADVRSRCPYCGERSYEWFFDNGLLNFFDMPHDLDDDGRMVCSVCGFWWDDTQRWGVGYAPARDSVAANATHYEFASLRSLDINSADLTMAEIGAHLRRRYGDVRFLSPRKFEELVADVYAKMGYQVRLTGQSRDGGYDVVLLERGSGEQQIVECKRYTGSRRVGISVVRQVLGAQVLSGVNKARIVTSSYFTSGAKSAAQGLSEDAGHSYEMLLIDADSLLRALGAYNHLLPPLEDWVAARRRAQGNRC